MDDEKNFALVYTDDVLVFSNTSLSSIGTATRAGLKLKPTKCHFLLESVEYLGLSVLMEKLYSCPDKMSGQHTTRSDIFKN